MLNRVLYEAVACESDGRQATCLRVAMEGLYPLAYLTFTNDSSHWLRPQQHLHQHLYLYLYLLLKTCKIEEGTEKLVTRQRSLLSCKCTSFLSRPPPVHSRSRKADIETSLPTKYQGQDSHRLGFTHPLSTLNYRDAQALLRSITTLAYPCGDHIAMAAARLAPAT